jgi:hypothetical protein
MNKWKKATITVPSKDRMRRNDYIPVRSNGKTVQAQEKREVNSPFGTIEEFNEDYAKAAQGLEDVTMATETYIVDDGGFQYPEAKIYATGWRSELTEDEKQAIEKVKFS